MTQYSPTLTSQLGDNEPIEMIEISQGILSKLSIKKVKASILVLNEVVISCPLSYSYYSYINRKGMIVSKTVWI